MASKVLYFSFVLVLLCISWHTCRDHENVHDEASLSIAYTWYTKMVEVFTSQYPNAFDNTDQVSAKTFSVDSYGAKGDGKTDDTKAFQKAWKEACSSKTAAVFSVPKNKKYLVQQIKFEGACQAPITMQVAGTILATPEKSKYKKDKKHWLTVERVDNLVLEGGGVIDGNGDIWWKTSCKVDKSRKCEDAPTALTLHSCKSLTVKNLKIQNAQKMHISFDHCENVQVSKLQVTAPEDSPNTDGIHITHTQDITVSDSSIGTGDDCISIETGSTNVQATGITCGPGHGISIGSLGDHNSEAYVSDITVDGAKLTGTTNGVRIKTWQGGSGKATNIKFKNIKMKNVKNPIIIDQQYCDQKKPCKEQSSAVEIKDVTYQSITGTSSNKEAITFDCSKGHPCQGIVLQDIDISREGDGEVKAKCTNAKVTLKGKVKPQCSKNIIQDQPGYAAYI
ncbi:polygalacturonase [Artemisia annua]|uniref:endo-polygalacturonase n=1 Tax=Artemisia annua TaxID=35608 RepID=A0A2U1M8J7_ARTAN|nr:polygalacturonase [Artemisia annua]